jgi:hypothetical protein
MKKKPSPKKPCALGIHLWSVLVAGSIEALWILTSDRSVKSAAAKAEAFVKAMANDSSRDRKPPAIVKVEYRGTIDA